MLVQSLIERKRDGGALAAAEWEALLAAYLADDVPDYQMSALLMAIVWRGLTPEELAVLTRVMRDSGARLAWPEGAPARVDKHSTGGVGDKVSLVLAPLVASLGLAVPMMSGRGLGHTGGTTDKLESIPGFRTDLPLAAVQAQVARIGVAMFGQTEAIAPADRRLYALRDVTGTVPAIPLIAASIMSKKLAEGLTGLVLDVKAGSGAFLPDVDDARALARTMVDLGEAAGCRTTALVTAMDRPLGRAIGNALEVEEALLALTGQGPEDLLTVTRALAMEMALLGGRAPDPAAALDGLPSGIPTMWLFHAPGISDDFRGRGYPEPFLSLAGHTHGGQIRLPLLPAVTPPASGRFVAGWYRDTFAPLYVSRGIGTSGIRARLGAPPEVVELTLQPA